MHRRYALQMVHAADGDDNVAQSRMEDCPSYAPHQRDRRDPHYIRVWNRYERVLVTADCGEPERDDRTVASMRWRITSECRKMSTTYLLYCNSPL